MLHLGNSKWLLTRLWFSVCFHDDTHLRWTPHPDGLWDNLEAADEPAVYLQLLPLRRLLSTQLVKQQELFKKAFPWTGPINPQKWPVWPPGGCLRYSSLWILRQDSLSPMMSRWPYLPPEISCDSGVPIGLQPKSHKSDQYKLENFIFLLDSKIKTSFPSPLWEQSDRLTHLSQAEKCGESFSYLLDLGLQRSWGWKHRFQLLLQNTALTVDKT